MNAEFQRKVDHRRITMGIIGLGYIGLPLVLKFVANGFHTVGFDIDKSKVNLLMAGKTYINHISDNAIAEMNKTEKFDATSDFRRISEVDVISICVPTPLTIQREPNLSYIKSTAEMIHPYLLKGQLIILESTTYPGTTNEILLPILEKSRLKAGKDFYLAFSPEREDPGNKTFTSDTIPKVIGGHTPEALERTSYLYSQTVAETVSVSSTRVAEAVKILENIFRSVNIALVNELKIIYSKMGIDIWEVIDARKQSLLDLCPFTRDQV